MDKWERLRIQIAEKRNSAAEARDMINGYARETYKQAEEAYHVLDGRAKAFADVLRTMEEIDNDIYSGN